MEGRSEAVGADIYCSPYRPSNVLDAFEWITSVKCPIILGTSVSSIVLTLVAGNFILYFLFQSSIKKRLILLSLQRELHFNLQIKSFLFSIPE